MNPYSFKSFVSSILLWLLAIAPLNAQILDPVKWSFASENLNDGTTKLIFKATFGDGWHVYSQKDYGDEGPIPTSFNFEKSTSFELVGKVKEGASLHKELDKQWGFEIEFYEHEALFTQIIKSKSEKPYAVKGNLEFMVCNETMCLPPTLIDFDINVTPPVKTINKEATNNEKGTELKDEASIAVAGEDATSNKLVEPVKWKWEVKELENNEAELIFTANIENGWHLYALETGSEDVFPTEIKIKPSKDFELVGELQQGEPITKAEPVFDNAELSYFEGSAVFKQKIKRVGNKAFKIIGEISYQSCNETQCIFPPVTEFDIDLDSLNEGVEKNTSSSVGNRSFLSIFIFGFLGGLAALLTPCVFPMIPFTVSFFTKRSKTKAEGIRNALTYGISIIGIYVALGLGVTIGFGPDALNALSTNVWFNLAFFLLLVIFAISFLGAFEITLPSSFINKIDAKSERGGLLGIFFMAFTLSLVSFSCTGPIIGTLLVDAAVNGGIKGPFWGMLGFSSALALPFGLFAAFPGWLNSLPKSGGWLNSVKVVLGFLELALALKFASNADLVVQAGIITREVFLVLWIVIFGLMGVYLMGWIKLSHDSDLPYLSVPRLFMAIFSFAFTIYLIPGLWGAPLKIISGFPPPDFYSESPSGFGNSIVVSSGEGENNKGHKSEHCPNGLPCFHDYYEALEYAKEVNKPLMIDFTGWACVNCRKMESQVWTDPEVDKRLRNDVVLVSLYVDDKNSLPEEEQRVEKLGERNFKIKTIGNKWSYLQASTYGTNTQPQYILLDGDEKMLNKPTSYDPDIDKYIQWLDEGIQKYKK